MINIILNALRHCDDYHKRCDYLLEHDAITYLLDYIHHLQKMAGITTIKCNKCGDYVSGDGKGTYLSCGCGAVAVDQTEHYTRIIGNKEDYEVVDK